MRMLVRNFLFHRVNDTPDPFWPAMLTTQFRQILRHIKSKYCVIPTADLLHLSTIKTTKPICTISFDDGFKDNVEYAAPILEYYKLPSTFFVVTNCIQTGIPTWTYQLDFRLFHTSNTVNFEMLKLSHSLTDDYYHHRITTINFAARLKYYLKQKPHADVLQILKEIVHQTADVQMPNVMMNWQQVLQLHRSGFSIGSHTHTHPLLHNSTPEMLNEELTLSKSLIEQQLNVCVEGVAYPVGGYNKAVMDAAATSGYKYGMAVDQHSHDMSAPKFALPRIELYNEPKWKIYLRMHEIQQKLKRVIGRA